MVVEVAELLPVDVPLAFLVAPARTVLQHDLGENGRLLVPLALARQEVVHQREHEPLASHTALVCLKVILVLFDELLQQMARQGARPQLDPVLSADCPEAMLEGREVDVLVEVGDDG